MRSINHHDFQYLLDLGTLDVDIDMNFAVSSDGMSPLMLACSFGNKIIVQLILRNKLTELAIEDYAGFNSLYYASFYGYVDILKELGQWEVPYSKSKSDGTTSLHIAAKRGHLEVVELFLTYKKMMTEWKLNHPWDGTIDVNERKHHDS